MHINQEMAQQIVDDIKASVHRDINFMDQDGVIIASTDLRRIGAVHIGARKILSFGLEELVIHQDEATVNTREGINLPIQVNGQAIGVIGVTGNAREVADLGLVVKKMTELMISAMRQQEIVSALKAAQFNLMEQWLFPDSQGSERGRQHFLQQASVLGVDLDLPRILAVCDYTPNSPEQAETLSGEETNQNAALIEHFRLIVGTNPQNICASINRHIVIVFAEKNLETVMSSIRKMKGEAASFFNLRLYCGISSETDDDRRVSQCYKEALAACKLAEKTKTGIVVYDLLQPEFLAQSVPRETLAGLWDTVFRGCGAKEVRDILDTLAAFYKHGGNCSQAAEEQFIHPNTFLYRLSKIQEKTGLNPRNPRETIPLFLISACDRLAISIVGQETRGRES